ncbi:response regulator [Rhodopirellula sp. JC639]|uniref:response regulator n=1 Tax=Stieleria mannarensis TaxID=2755585 RepID=UPI0016049F42|nr:response regulator [Rhodopirellula sp. JC639]
MNRHGAVKLLYIDDDVLGLKSLTVLMQTLGYQIESAESATAGLEMVRQEKFDLVLTDMNMPGMNGLRLTQEVKTIAPNTPVIVITGSIDAQRSDQTDDGPDCVLVKPLDLQVFSEQVNRLLNREPSREPQ